jgi:hypothetical protein
MEVPAWLRWIVVAASVSASVHADISTLTVVGPHSGSAFANLGAIPKATRLPTMSKAVVNILLKPGNGEDLTAECTAKFTMNAGPGEPEPILVAFPVTGQGGNAVTVDSFVVAVNGAPVSTLLRGPVRFPQLGGEAKEESSRQPTFDELARAPWRPISFPLGDGSTYPSAYYWSQIFPPDATTTIEVRYQLTLHPQSLRYEKKVLHGGSVDVVPFDLNWAGSSDQKAYFFDYVLRSGATWAGPIGHETVTLVADPATQLDLSDEEIIIVGRNVARYFDDDTGKSRGMVRAGVDAKGIKRPGSRILWEIDHEKPTQDILIEIPANLRKRAQQE